MTTEVAPQLPLPLPEVEVLRIANSALRAEVEVLRIIRDGAHYLYGSEECIERECEEYEEHLEDDPALQSHDLWWCSHVEHRYATWRTDVQARTWFEQLAVEVLRLVDRPDADTIGEVREAVHSAIYSMLTDDDGIQVDETRPPYKTVLDHEYVATIVDGVAADVAAGHDRPV